MNLYDLKEGEKAVISKIKGRGAFRKRIIEMGFVKGNVVTRIKDAPLKDPIEYSILGYHISLRKNEAQLIETVNESEVIPNEETHFYNGLFIEKSLKKTAHEKGKNIDIALVGNPNCGKTTIFNYASGSKERVGNYGGVTVEQKEGIIRHKRYTFNVVDLPGTYSLSAYSPEELYVRRYIYNAFPDVVVNVVDASNLERNLYLSTQLIDMDVKMVIALNMYDELEKSGDRFDYEELGKMIGIPIVPTVGSKGKGVKELLNKIIDVYEENDPSLRHVHINYGYDVETSLRKIQDLIWENKGFTDKISSRFYAIKMLEKDHSTDFASEQLQNYSEIKERAGKEINKLETQLRDDTETIISDARYGFISGALKETYTRSDKPGKAKTTSGKIDKFLTNKYLGFPIFLLFLWITFQSVFSLGQYPMDWIDKLILLISNQLNMLLPAGIIKDLLIEGIIGGVGGVIVFLPNIVILFFFITLMEDSGYMARAAFIMDKLMHKIGLHGKSFIPLIMGFGCNVPAIMATRTIENKNERLLTILINPFMSCSARLPVYILLIAAFFPKNPVLTLFLVYMIGIAFAIVLSIVFKKTLFKSKEAPFVMELPPYRMPTAHSVLKHVWYKASQYLKKMGGIILIASVVIWFLNYFPRSIEYSKDYEAQMKKTEKVFNEKIASTDKKAQIDMLENQRQEKISSIQFEKASEKQEKSFIGRTGKFIEPVLRPLGFDWKIGVSLLTGVMAKEIVISTMGVLYQVEPDSDGRSVSLTEKLRQQTYESGPKKGNVIFNPFVAFGLLMFILLYFPCVAVISAVKKETGSWKYAVFMVFYTTGLAYTVALLVNQAGKLFL